MTQPRSVGTAAYCGKTGWAGSRREACDWLRAGWMTGLVVGLTNLSRAGAVVGAGVCSGIRSTRTVIRVFPGRALFVCSLGWLAAVPVGLSVMVSVIVSVVVPAVVVVQEVITRKLCARRWEVA